VSAASFQQRNRLPPEKEMAKSFFFDRVKINLNKMPKGLCSRLHLKMMWKVGRNIHDCAFFFVLPREGWCRQIKGNHFWNI
jgi:hypothetical protein